MSDVILTKLTDFVMRSEGFGTPGSEITESIRGLNILPGHAPLRVNTDTLGYVFFTKPRFNLSYNNLLQDRRLAPFMTSDPKSMHYAIKHLLSPDLIKVEGGEKSPLIMHDLAFIPILSNSLELLDGWPDNNLDTYTSTEGIAKESHSWVDGIYGVNGAYDLTANFRNTNNDPVTLLITLWLIYMSNVYLGYMTPWPKMMLTNRIDYYTRIYRFVLDMNEQYVTAMTCTGWSFPTADNIGAKFKYDRENPVSTETAIISIPFRSVVACHMDVIIAHEFNVVTQLHCAEMTDTNRENYMLKVPREMRYILNRWCYPRIDLDTFEFEWWIKKTDYVVLKEKYNLD